MTNIDQNFTHDEIAMLQRLVDMIIPASDEFMLPSAKDETIFADFIGSAETFRVTISTALKALEQSCQDQFKCDFTELEAKDSAAAVDRFRQNDQAVSDLIATITAQCYYRDDRIMAALDMETRAPFPDGYSIEEGNWSLLDPVRDLPPIYRKVT